MMRRDNIRRHARGAGFTLVELLVAIAIIAVLGAMLYPVMARAREQARKTSCVSNLRQLGQGLEMYRQDHDGWWPFENSPAPHECVCSPFNARAISTTIYPAYVPDKRVFRCPSSRRHPLEVHWPDRWNYNGRLSHTLTDGSYIDDEAALRLVWDLNWGAVPWPPDYTTVEVYQNHAYGFNTVFADTHVRWEKLAQADHSQTY